MYVSLTFCVAYLSAIAAHIGRAADGVVNSDLVSDFLDVCGDVEIPIPGDPVRVDGGTWSRFGDRWGRVLVARAVTHKAFKGTDLRLLERAIEDAVRVCPRLSPSLSLAATEEYVRRLIAVPAGPAAAPASVAADHTAGLSALLAATRDARRSAANCGEVTTYTLVGEFAAPTAGPRRAT